MQGQQVFKHGQFWCLRYRERVIENGVETHVRKFKRLIPKGCPRQQAVDEAEKIVGKLPGAVPESIDTIGRFINETFLPHCKETRKPATYVSYSGSMRLLKKQKDFWAMRLKEVTTADIHELLTKIATIKTRDGKQRAQGSIRAVRVFLSAAFKYAINHALITHNPVRDAITPKGRAAKETYAYTLAEIQAIIAALADNSTARTVVLVAALTGLRKSEIQGLKWGDFGDGVLHVRRSIWNGAEISTKSDNSADDIPLLPIVAQALEQHKARNGYNQWVFHGATGSPIRLGAFCEREIRPVLGEAGITWQGWHSFRRGLATNLHELGVPDKIIQKILRHANVATTMRFYIKARPEATAAQMAKLETAFTAAGTTKKRA
jgi:integrase